MFRGGAALLCLLLAVDAASLLSRDLLRPARQDEIEEADKRYVSRCTFTQGGYYRPKGAGVVNVLTNVITAPRGTTIYGLQGNLPYVVGDTPITDLAKNIAGIVQKRKTSRVYHGIRSSRKLLPGLKLAIGRLHRRLVRRLEALWRTLPLRIRRLARANSRGLAFAMNRADGKYHRLVRRLYSRFARLVVAMIQASRRIVRNFSRGAVKGQGLFSGLRRLLRYLSQGAGRLGRSFRRGLRSKWARRGMCSAWGRRTRSEFRRNLRVVAKHTEDFFGGVRRVTQRMRAARLHRAARSARLALRRIRRHAARLSGLLVHRARQSMQC